MLSFTHTEPRFGRANPEFRRTWASADPFSSDDQTDEIRYLEARAEQELECAAAATHLSAELIHLELARAYRARVRALRPPQKALSWLDERGAFLPSD